MDDHETRRKIIREWMSLPTDKRQTAEQATAFAKKAVQQNEFHRSRRDPDQNLGAILLRRSRDGCRRAQASRDPVLKGGFGADRRRGRAWRSFQPVIRRSASAST